MTKKKGDRSHSIHYVDRDGRPTLPVSGAYGGVSSTGSDVIVHVYQDWGMVPSIEQLRVGTGGVIDSKTIKRGDVNREVQATLVMSPEVAITLGQWLVEKGAVGLTARKQTPPPDLQIDQEGT